MVLTKGMDLLPKACLKNRLSDTRLSGRSSFLLAHSFTKKGLLMNYTANKAASFAVMFSIELALQVPRYG